MTRRSRLSLTDNVLRSTRALCVGAAIFLFLLASGSFSYAQTSSSALRSDEKPTFWLVDENGSWRAPLPNWTIEEVMRIVDSNKETESASPWAIQSLDATGGVEGGVAGRPLERRRRGAAVAGAVDGADALRIDEDLFMEEFRAADDGEVIV